MANPTTKGFTELVRDMVTTIQGKYPGIVDTSVGSVVLAVVDAVATIVLWLQSLVLQLFVLARAATSSGEDLDSWFADFGFKRAAASTAKGQVTFARFSSANQVTVPVGGTIQTDDGSQKYLVLPDTGNPAYSSLLAAYVLLPSVSSVTVPVEALVAGAAGNALAGRINTITQAMPGIDTVTNAEAFTSGEDAEKDMSARISFVGYIASLSKATMSAIGYAIRSLKQGVSYSLVENEDYGGTLQYGYFYAVVDDGTGTPDSTFLASAFNAIDQVRGFTVEFGVFAPVIVGASVNMIITTDDGYDHNALVGLVGDAVTGYINSLELGEKLSWSKLIQIAYEASPGVINVTGVTLNGGTADLLANRKQRIKAETVTVA